MAKFEKTLQAIGALESEETITISQMLEAYRQFYEEMRRANGTAPEYLGTGGGDRNVMLLCWMARMTERIYRLHEQELAVSDTQQRWEKAEEKLKTIRPVLEERARIIEALEEKITEADNAADLALSRQLHLQEELAEKEQEKEKVLALQMKAQEDVNHMTEELAKEKQILEAYSEQLEEKKRELEEKLRQQEDLVSRQGDIARQIESVMQDIEEQMSRFRGNLDLIFAEETNIGNNPIIAEEWLKDRNTALTLQDEFREEYDNAVKAYERCLRVQQGLTELISHGDLK